MFKYMVKVVVGAVAVYALNEHFKKTHMLEELAKAGKQIADGFFTELVRAKMAAQQNQNGGMGV